MRLIHFYMFSLGKCGKIWKNRPFFRADMAGLGKYCMGGYGRIGVYRVKALSRSYYIPLYFCLPNHINEDVIPLDFWKLNHFFNFYFLNMDILFNLMYSKPALVGHAVFPQLGRCRLKKG